MSEIRAVCKTWEEWHVDENTGELEDYANNFDGTDIDYYFCKDCKKEFGDDWKLAKKHVCEVADD